MVLERREYLKQKKKIDVEVVDFPNKWSTAILAVTEKGEILLERHYRYAPTVEILEVPAGWLEKGEKPAEGARRELLEETGFTSKEMKSLGYILPAPGYSTERIFLFLARIDTKSQMAQKLEESEIIEIEYYSKVEVLRMIRKGEITDSMTISSVCRASLRGLI